MAAAQRLPVNLADPEWDAAFFKRLAHNDTAQALGHQSGIVLPKELRQYLPDLDERATTGASPTVDRLLQAEMYDGRAHVADADVRYQFQTWHGTRSPESRITDGLLPLRNRARSGDLLVFQRRADSLDRFRLILIRQRTRAFAAVAKMVAGRRWGPLTTADNPVSQAELQRASGELEVLAATPFQVQRNYITRAESRQSRIARSAAFRARVRAEYGGRCSVSGISVVVPSGRFEVESAHVVPLSEGGSDDLRNGLALTRTLHWAFDRGLFGVRPNRRVYVPKQVRRQRSNKFICGFAGRVISEAKSSTYRVHADALQWHLENRVLQWD